MIKIYDSDWVDNVAKKDTNGLYRLYRRIQQTFNIEYYITVSAMLMSNSIWTTCCTWIMHILNREICFFQSMISKIAFYCHKFTYMYTFLFSYLLHLFHVRLCKNSFIYGCSYSCFSIENWNQCKLYICSVPCM